MGEGKNGNGVTKGIKMAWLVFIILLTIGAYAGSYGVLRNTVSNHDKQIEKLEIVVNDVNNRLATIQNDTKWIMQSLGKR